MPRMQQATLFTAPSGKAFVYLTDIPRDGEVLYSLDGVDATFYALASKGFAGTNTEHKLSFYDPHHGVGDKLHRNGEVIEYGGELYVQQDTPFDQSSVVVVPLPATRRTEYLCQAGEGTLFYVSADAYNYSYGSFKLFIGDGKNMREVVVQEVMRYRDATYIRTPEEIFFSPSLFKAQRDLNLVPQWGEQNLTHLNQDDYDIVETPEGEVSITKR